MPLRAAQPFLWRNQTYDDGKEQRSLTAAREHAGKFRRGAEATKNSVQIKQSHELDGRIALADKDYATALTELQQSNLQDPRNLYRLSQAYQAKGDRESARRYLAQSVSFNLLPALNYAFIRLKVQKLVAQAS